MKNNNKTPKYSNNHLWPDSYRHNEQNFYFFNLRQIKQLDPRITISDFSSPFDCMRVWFFHLIKSQLLSSFFLRFHQICPIELKLLYSDLTFDFAFCYGSQLANHVVIDDAILFVEDALTAVKVFILLIGFWLAVLYTHGSVMTECAFWLWSARLLYLHVSGDLVLAHLSVPFKKSEWNQSKKERHKKNSLAYTQSHRSRSPSFAPLFRYYFHYYF